MPTNCLIKHSTYHDSVALMQVARELTQLPGVLDAAVVMGTPANQAILREASLMLPEIEAAAANDLVIVVRAETDERAAHALQVAENRLAHRPESGETGSTPPPRTIRQAVRRHPGANLAVISVAGQYAAAEAWEALRNGLHVFLFSDHVSLADELALKQYAIERGRLLMGPDCGTAILNGVALGFANDVPRGPVGIVAAAGTGLQEVSALLARLGVGVSQAIGTGGHDLSAEVGGLTMLAGVRALQADPETKGLLLVSKPPDEAVAARVLAQVRQGDKPTVICFLGGDAAPIAEAGAIPARTLQEAAYRAATLATAADGAEGAGTAVEEIIERETAELRTLARALQERLKPDQTYLRGLFSGGTLAAETLLLWSERLDDVRSNLALDPRLGLPDPACSVGHCVVDLGADEFTVGRPHPMLDHTLRARRLMQEADDPQVAAILLDVVLGYGVHSDPAGELGPVIRRARETAAQADRELLVVASVTGTEQDPQGLSQQVQTLEECGAVVAGCNAAAARLAVFIARPDL